MERSDAEIREFLASADAIRDLSIVSVDEVETQDYASAAASYALVTELAYAMASSMQKAAANDLKCKYLPADLLTRDDTPQAGDDKGSGNYL